MIQTRGGNGLDRMAGAAAGYILKAEQAGVTKWDVKYEIKSLENLRDGGAWWGAVYGVAQSPTRLK